MARSPIAVIALALCVAAVACTPATPEVAAALRRRRQGTIVVGVSGAFTENQLVAEMYARRARARRVHGRAAVRAPVAGGLADRARVRARSTSSPSTCRRCSCSSTRTRSRRTIANDVVAQGPRAARGEGDHGAGAGAGAGHQHVRGERRDGPTVRADDDDVARGGGEPTDAGRAARMSTASFCLTGLKDVYGILFDDFTPLDAGGPQTVAALKSDEVQVGLLFSTDPSIERERVRAPGRRQASAGRREHDAGDPHGQAERRGPRCCSMRVSARLTTENVTVARGQGRVGRSGRGNRGEGLPDRERPTLAAGTFSRPRVRATAPPPNARRRAHGRIRCCRDPRMTVWFNPTACTR